MSLLRSSLLVGLIILLSAFDASAQSATFAGRDYPILGDTHVAADLNGDGAIDLAGAGSNARVMLGNGDGSFRPLVEYPAGGYTEDVAAGDLNGDGKLDLVVTNNNAQIAVTVLLGNGDGTFGAPASYPNDAGASSPSVVIADFDHDGRLDVVAAHDMACFTAPCVVADTISLWRGLGDGTLQPAQQIRVGAGLARLAVADFNGDGNRDLGIAAAFGKVFILLGNGDGTFRQLPDLVIVQGETNTDIDTGDFNGDLIPDLAVAPDVDHRTVVLLGNGDGTFRQSASIADAFQERIDQLTVADFNNDSFQDVALGMANCCTQQGDGMVGVLYGNGDGTFKPVVRYLVPGFLVGKGGAFLTAADFNGDGKRDIALEVRGNNAATYVLVNTTGRATAPLAYGALTVSPSSTIVGGTSAEIEVSLAPGAVAPTGSLPLTISSSNPSIVSVPTVSRSMPVAVGIIAGMSNVRFKVDTSNVTAPQTVNINISNNRIGSRIVALRVTPPNTPLAVGSIQLQPPFLYGGNDGSGVVSLATGHVAPSGGATVILTNNNASLVSTPASVTIPAGWSDASFPIQTVTTGINTPVNISASYGGATKTAVLTVAAPSQNVPISSVTLSPSTVAGGSNVGVRVTVNLSAGAPPEGATIMLTSSNPSVIKVPRTIRTNFSGQTSAFADVVATTVSATTQVTITATYGSSSQSAILTVTPQTAPPPPPPATQVTLTASVTGRSGERVISNPTGLNVVVGSSGSASFASGTLITLSVSNGRDAIWGGACSSGGSKAKTCRFTLSGNAAVTANVQ
ncbi:MAG TPA: FG-GAP-like repeat-containing protein [Pyrinomonadaceae bacterium]|nr:FG-GAP-like repeat-containing protein [Pyrinomonadaceae bacterium]